MMKKYTLLSIGLMFISLTISAQNITFGAKAGVTFSRFNQFKDIASGEKLKQQILFNLGEAVEINSSSFKNEMYNGATGGLYANISLNKKFAVQLEFLFSQIGNINTSTLITEEVPFYSSPLKVISKSTTNLNLIALPIMLQYGIYKGIYFAAGPQFNFLVNGKEKFSKQTLLNDELFEDFPEEINKKDSTIENYKELDIALNVGLGYITSFGLNIDARYSLGGITNLSGLEIKPRNIQLTLGYDIIKPAN